MAKEIDKTEEKDDTLLCAGCGKPIESEPGGLNHARIAKILGSSEVYHAGCHPKGQMIAQGRFGRRM